MSKCHYRIDIHLDGNGGRVHHTYKSQELSKVIYAAWNHPDSISATLWTVWKEFETTSRHVMTLQPSDYKLRQIMLMAIERDAGIAEPIPVPDNPQEEWV